MTWSWECGYRLTRAHIHSQTAEKPSPPLDGTQTVPCGKGTPKVGWRLRLLLSISSKGQVAFSIKHHSWTQSLLLPKPVIPLSISQRTEKASPSLSWEERALCLKHVNPSVFSFPRWLMLRFLRSQCLLSSLTALLLAAAAAAVAGFSMWCIFKPHSLILSFPNIQHPCTLLTSGFFKRLEISSGGLRLSSQW